MQIRKALFGAGLSLAALAAAAAILGSVGHAPRTVPSRDAAVAAAAGTVIGRRPQSLPASLQLSGTVLDMGTASSGTMTVRVGSASTTTPVSLPDYQLTLASADPDAMVSIELQAQGQRSSSILGTYRRLARLAGADAQLGVAELDRLRLSPFSTSLAFFLRRDLGGLLPASDAAHEAALRSVDTGDVITAVSTLTALSDGAVALPGGFADGMALIADRTAYRAFLAANPQVHGHAGALARTPSIALKAGDLPKLAWMASGQASPDPAQVFGPGGQILATTAAGYELHAMATRRNAAFDGTFSAGQLQLTPRSPIFLADTYPIRQVVPGQPNSQVLERTELLAESFRRVFVGDRFSLWLATQQVSVSYPEYPQVAPEQKQLGPTVHVVSDLQRSAAAIGPAQLVGQRALPMLCREGTPVQLVACEYAVHNFYAAGSGATENVGAKVDGALRPVGVLGGSPFQWRYSQRGSFSVTTPAATVTWWRLDAGNSAVVQLAYLATTQDGGDTLSLAGSTAMITATATGGFGELLPQGSWLYASFRQFSQQVYAYDQASAPVTTLFHRNPDGTGLRSQRSDDAAYADDYDLDNHLGWQLLDGRLYDTRYRANVPANCGGAVPCSGFASCEAAFAAGATQCAPLQVRYFRPLARIGDGLYGIEDLYSVIGGSYSPPYPVQRNSRANHYQKLQ